MQPTFLPWLGFFDLIDQSDNFVLLDSVQFEKQSWQQRNRARGAEKLEWMTVPVFIKGRFGQSIQDVEIRTDQFPEKIVKSIDQHYGKCRYYSEYRKNFIDILTRSKTHRSLATLNAELINWLIGELGINVNLYFSSRLKTEGTRSGRLVSILERLNGKMYLSPRGSYEYIMEDRQIFKKAGIDVCFQNYSHPVYEQRYKPFVPGASIIDLLFNEGPASLDIIRSGRMPSQTLDEIATLEGNEIVYR